jgi:hypothetical protein
MTGTRTRLTLAFLVVVGAILFVAGGSAGPRDADATFAAFPGPGLVSYGELIAYKAEFTTLSDSTLTHVRFRQTIPVAEGQPATFDSSTCPSTPTIVSTPNGPEWVCNFGSVPAGTPKLQLTIVWRVPTLDSTENCPSCLVSTGRWTVKEGVNDQTNPNDSFGLTTTNATLLAIGGTSAETLLAGGYETAGTSCGSASAPGNLRTHGLVGLANPVVSKFCLPSFLIPIGDPNLGFAATITETSGNPHGSVICIAALGTNCGPSHIDAVFAAPYVTHVFEVADAALKELDKNYNITEITHNGEILPLCADEPDNANGCVVSISPPKGNPKVWVIVAQSPTNGPWDW